MKILAIGAHADDVELGCGGSLLAWARAGHEIVIHVASDSAYAAPDGRPVRTVEVAIAEAQASARAIGARLEIGSFRCLELEARKPLNDAMVSLIARENPDVLLSHWAGDTHSDHAALSMAVLHAARRVPTVLLYASNAYPGAQTFDPRVFVDISAVLEEKLELVALHQSEDTRTNGAWRRWLQAEAVIMGHKAGCAVAEGFVLVRQLLALPSL